MEEKRRKATSWLLVFPTALVGETRKDGGVWWRMETLRGDAGSSTPLKLHSTSPITDHQITSLITPKSVTGFIHMYPGKSSHYYLPSGLQHMRCRR
ncbi:hypothetical protein OCU04_006493 [Sclerotinia nivalis]|uniref:Uncharacterized protein n=1 Tax=Sclerotinia nivalis TaxID=352851 RepID=A0A9X0AND3_9HELO|nr:hypothetical protein OCU04_006493 [Sclerotinia nivalis]